MKCEYICCVSQASKVGAERVEVAQILQSHHVIVRGGPEQGKLLMDALLVSHSLRPAPQFMSSSTKFYHSQL